MADPTIATEPGACDFCEGRPDPVAQCSACFIAGLADPYQRNPGLVCQVCAWPASEPISGKECPGHPHLGVRYY